MPESTLAAAFADLTGDVGWFLGYGRGADNGETAWTTQQQAAVTRCVKGGLRNFYHCSYNWSFLHPVHKVTLPSGSQTVPLPDDFGGLEGPITVSATDQAGFGNINVVGDVRSDYAGLPSATGRPVKVCIDPIRGTTHSGSSRFNLYLYPQADQAYTLQFSYYLHPNYLDGQFPYAYGGAQHAETILEACLAVAEKVLDDTIGVHSQEYEKLLAQSKRLDERNKPQNLGYNADRSEGKWNAMNYHALNRGVVCTFGGVEPS